MGLIPRSRGGMLWRFLLAAIVVIAGTAATTAVAGLLQVHQFVVDLHFNKPLSNKGLQLPAPGQPQTILIIGSDHRAHEPFREAQTDTILLARLNSKSSTINLLSIPRDLKVQIPGYGTAKINSAYEDGGPNLLMRTIRQNVFPGLKVNHIIDVNFGGFSDLVDAIGCVYGAVDHRYYNNTALTNYSSIDIQPGYQKLCGDDQAPTGALAFVRFRHTDTDLVRNARQQDFIRWAKDQYSVSKLYANRDRLLTIFGHHAVTDRDLQSEDGLLDLFNLVLNADGSTVRSIAFPAALQTCVAAPVGQPQLPCYVDSTSTAALGRVYKELMTPTKAAVAKAATTGAAQKTPTGAGQAHKHTAIPKGLIADSADGRQQAAALARVHMLVYYPKLILAGSTYCSSLTGNCNDGQEPAYEYNHSYPRFYSIHDAAGKAHAAYYMTIALNQLQGQYYGVQGTTWTHPPLLAHPSATKVVNGRKLQLFAAGGKLTTVSWRTATAVYWISNTLTNNVSNAQMVAIAASLTRAMG